MLHILCDTPGDQWALLKSWTHNKTSGCGIVGVACQLGHNVLISPSAQREVRTHRLSSSLGNGSSRDLTDLPGGENSSFRAAPKCAGNFTPDGFQPSVRKGYKMTSWGWVCLDPRGALFPRPPVTLQFTSQFRNVIISTWCSGRFGRGAGGGGGPIKLAV